MKIPKTANTVRFGVLSAALIKSTALFDPVRFGVLSAALINPTALFDPVLTHPDAVVVAVARDLTKSQTQAKWYGIPKARILYRAAVPIGHRRRLHPSSEWVTRRIGDQGHKA